MTRERFQTALVDQLRLQSVCQYMVVDDIEEMADNIIEGLEDTLDASFFVDPEDEPELLELDDNKGLELVFHEEE